MCSTHIVYTYSYRVNVMRSRKHKVKKIINYSILFLSQHNERKKERKKKEENRIVWRKKRTQPVEIQKKEKKKKQQLAFNTFMLRYISVSHSPHHLLLWPRKKNYLKGNQRCMLPYVQLCIRTSEKSGILVLRFYLFLLDSSTVLILNVLFILEWKIRTMLKKKYSKFINQVF